ncbi:MAG: hypothetical protein WAU15_02710, partial [Nitrosomonas sp.]
LLDAHASWVLSVMIYAPLFERFRENRHPCETRGGRINRVDRPGQRPARPKSPQNTRPKENKGQINNNGHGNKKTAQRRCPLCQQAVKPDQ